MGYEPKLLPHPSGRPIHHRRVVGKQIWRVPDEGPVTPRLRDKPLAHAIGFRAQLVSDDQEPPPR